MIIQANSLRIPLADNSVHCVITSPPYWGLRDYGTAMWEGGEEVCDHVDNDKLAERRRQKKSMIVVGERTDGSTRTRIHDETIGGEWQYRATCAKCGAGWERVVERNLTHEKLDQSQLKNDAKQKGLTGSSGRTRTALDSVDPQHKNPGYTTLGWQPTCECNAGNPVPAIVLDPFCGSGTVGEVCHLHGRKFVGLDLSWKYLTENALPRAEMKQTEASLRELPLFGGESVEKTNKQDGVGKNTYTGFNARWRETHD